MAVPTPPRPNESSMLVFSIVVFAIAIAIGAAVTWLGITGRIGGPIP